jgi:hypothetical protein
MGTATAIPRVTAPPQPVEQAPAVHREDGVIVHQPVDLRADVRRMLLVNLTLIGALLSVWAAFALDASSLPAWIQALTNEAPIPRAGILALGGALIGLLAGLLAVRVVLRRRFDAR